MNTLTEAVRELHNLSAALSAHCASATKETARLTEEIVKRRSILALSAVGIDLEKVALAKTVVYATKYANGGTDRATCLNDAIKQLATGFPIGAYCNLWEYYFGTKNYDRWSGQRSDHSYGCGPRHGSTCFEVGFTREVRARDPKQLTADEVEAAIYYLANLERIQKAEEEARQPLTTATT